MLKQSQRESWERLHPSLRNPNWLILRRRRQIFETGLSQLPAHGLSVLDIGGRLQPYRSLLGSRAKNYIAIDVHIAPLVNVGAAVEALPFRDEQFDFVICTQVFEYLPEPSVGGCRNQPCASQERGSFPERPIGFPAEQREGVLAFLTGGLAASTAGVRDRRGRTRGQQSYGVFPHLQCFSGGVFQA